MRVADRSTTRNYLKYVNTAKGAYTATSEQIFSGNRFSRLSDDVSAGTKVLHTRMDKYKAETHLTNVSAVNDELVQAEDNMSSMNDILSRVHELAIKAGSEDKGSALEEIAIEIESLRTELLSLFNDKHGDKYLFGGSNSSLTAPFQKGEDGRLEYNGIPMDDIQKDDDGGYFYMETLPDGTTSKIPIPMDEDVYMDIGLGIKMNESQIEDGTGFLVSFSGLDIVGFGKDPETGLSNNLYNNLLDLENNIREGNTDKLMKNADHLKTLTEDFGGNITDIGSKTKYLSNMEGRLEKNVDNYSMRISGLMGTDDTEAATTLAMNDYVLKAVQQMGARIIPVTLMDFLR